MFRTIRTKRTAWAAFAGFGLLGLTLVACEHEHSWRGSHRRSDAEIAEYSDPAKAREALNGMMKSAPRRDDKELVAYEAAFKRSEGCISCHGYTDDPDMHDTTAFTGIMCIDCHGGKGDVMNPMGMAARGPKLDDKGQPLMENGAVVMDWVGGRPGEAGTTIEDSAYLEAMHTAHVQPDHPEAWYGKEQISDGTRKFGEHAHHADPRHMHGSRNPENTYALLNDESPAFIRFMNPGDLRVADMACGSCHNEGAGHHVARVKHSMMAHGAQLWGAVLYNNASTYNKVYTYGESYSPFGLPQRMQGVVFEYNDKEKKSVYRNPTQEELTKRGVLPFLEPLPTWNITQPGNILRIFERGQKLPQPEIGIPGIYVEPGKPDKQLSPRGLGTNLRTDPVFLGIQKTRLLDPILWFLGTNDHPGDYRNSGCTACHVVYANDRTPYAVARNAKGELAYAETDSYTKYGNMGRAAPDSKDPTISKRESGHPIKHVLTNKIPNSQCVVCHMHPGTSFANTYLGYMWWDNESDGELMYPNRTRTPTPEQEWLSLRRNPEGASLKGLWGNLYPEATSHAGEQAGPDFLERSGTPRKGDGSTINDRTKHNQFADFHGHGWMFRAIYKKDKRGNMLDRAGTVIDANDPKKFDKGVHLMDVHLEKGMQCVDCHFVQDMHGDGRLYGETRNAVEITCIDCHGTLTEYANLKSSGPAAMPGGRNLKKGLRFEWSEREKDGKTYKVLLQRSAMNSDVVWEIPQTLDTVNPNSLWSLENPQSASASRYAKTVQRDPAGDGSITWGDIPTVEKNGKKIADDLKLAHGESEMECYTCHTSWMTSCAGCHLPMKANQRTPMLHNENIYTRNFTQYNYQVLREDTYMLGRDSTLKAIATGRDPVKQGGKIVPVRSSSAVLVSSQNAQREWIYSQAQTVSAEGYSGQAFNPHFPHATGGVGTTKMCTDCHVSKEGDNNAWMAQLLLQGTNMVNFLGRFVYVAEGREGLSAVVATEREEPQAVFGSNLHNLAYPDEYSKFVAGGRKIHESYHHGADAVLEFNGAEILDLQMRGEYLYAARGRGGFLAFDVANIDNKGFSERIISAPVSPLGQRMGFKTSYAVAIASPATIAVDPARIRMSNDPTAKPAGIMEPAREDHVNAEQPVHPMYAYLYIGDRDEGLILSFAGTLLDGDPQNNFLERAKLDDGTTAFNPGGILDGMTHLVVAGHYIYATAKAGLVVIDIDKPLAPKVVGTVGTDSLTSPQSVAVQFRYAFVTDAQGLKVVEVTNPAAPRIVPGALVPMEDAKRVYIARTNAYVAAGKQGLGIVDVTAPERPRLDQFFTAGGIINDARDVKVGMTNASLFAYVADGRNGLRVVQLMSPNSTPNFKGFAFPLSPTLVATKATDGPALAVSKGLDRDRAVDESGNQIAVFGRLGARPLNLEDSQRMYLRNGQVWFVSDKPDSQPQAFTFSSNDTKVKGGEEEKPRGRRGSN
ncbi:MAG: hypothetical protein ACT4PL_01875 [Phycisphaerales bacterium]